MPRITETVKHLLLINIILFIGSMLFFESSRDVLAMYYPASEFFRPFQIVTHMFMHVNFNHLLFNMFALYMFGSALEAYWGSKRFLFFYLFCGFGALALYLLVWHFEISALSAQEYAFFLKTPYRMMGASGAVFGLLMGYGLMFPNSTIMLLIPPIPLKAKYFVIIYASIEFFFGISKMQTGVAHFAHLGGALFGLLLILFWRRTDRS